jgi:hypothetical protein
MAVKDLGAVTLGDSQFDTVNFAPQDRAGNPVAATITGSCDTPAKIAVAVAADGKSGTMTAVAGQAPGGPYTVTYSGNNPDGTPIEDVTVEVTVVTEAASSLNATLGTPAEQA